MRRYARESSLGTCVPLWHHHGLSLLTGYQLTFRTSFLYRREGKRAKLSDVSREADLTAAMEMGRKFTFRPLRPDKCNGLPEDVGMYQVGM